MLRWDGGDSRLQGSATVFWWASLESLAGESYETEPHILSYFDNFSGPVDSFGNDRHIRLAIFRLVYKCNYFNLI